jgi:hypothetical protein
MKSRAERLQRLRGKGMDAAKLERAEETLHGVGDAELPPEWVDATVAKVTRTVSRRRLVRGLALAAAVLVVMVLTASTTILWNGRNAQATLTYPAAVEILLEGSPDHIARTAMAIAAGRIEFAIRVFRDIQEDPRTTREPREAAERQLARLKNCLDGAHDPSAGSTSDAFLNAGDRARENALRDDIRVEAVNQLGTWSVSGIQAIQAVRASKPELTHDCDLAIKAIRKKLP